MFLVDTFRLSLGKASPIALHIVLIIGVMAYTIFGALVIQYLEDPRRIASSSRPSRQSDAIELPLNVSGARIAQLYPGLHDCVRLAVSNVLSRTGCGLEAEEATVSLNQVAITSLDDCYREAARQSGRQKAKKVQSTTTPGTSTKHIKQPEEEVEVEKWTFENSLIFSFTVITTIGYGHIVPETSLGRVFVIFFGLIGVPFTLLTIADLGMFLARILHSMTRWSRSAFSRLLKRSIDTKKEKKLTVKEEAESSDDRPIRKFDESLVLGVVFLLYLLIGARILATYEPDMNFFEALYFNFVTLTTIGLGDFVPKSYDYLLLTLCYIGVGLALTTMAVEIAADALKKIHYFGRKIENVANVAVWFGGKKMTMARLIKNLGDQLNIPEEELQNLNLTNFVDAAVKVEQGEIATLRNPEVAFRDRALSYSAVRRSNETTSLQWVDEFRSSRGETVGMPPLAEDTARTITTVREASRKQRLERESTVDRRAAATKVRFSELSFEASETGSNSMNYSDESTVTTPH